MSKGDDTTKRTNFKKFNEGWDKIDWTTKEVPNELPQDITDQISRIASRIDKEIEQIEQDRANKGKDEI